MPFIPRSQLLKRDTARHLRHDLGPLLVLSFLSLLYPFSPSLPPSLSLTFDSSGLAGKKTQSRQPNVKRAAPPPPNLLVDSQIRPASQASCGL